MRNASLGVGVQIIEYHRLQADLCTLTRGLKNKSTVLLSDTCDRKGITIKLDKGMDLLYLDNSNMLPLS